VTSLAKHVWPDLRLMMLPFAWLAWFPSVAIMLAGTGLILRAFMDGGARLIGVTYAITLGSVAAMVFNMRRQNIRDR
jgi:cytochrome c oxidase subunit IV